MTITATMIHNPFFFIYLFADHLLDLVSKLVKRKIRLYHEVVGAELLSMLYILVFAQVREDYYRRARHFFVLADLLQDAETVSPGQEQVKQDKIRNAILNDLESFVAILRCQHEIAFFCQLARRKLLEECVIFNYKNFLAHRAIVPCCAKARLVRRRGIGWQAEKEGRPLILGALEAHRSTVMLHDAFDRIEPDA